jgi:hypothetical protein
MFIGVNKKKFKISEAHIQAFKKYKVLTVLTVLTDSGVIFF